MSHASSSAAALPRHSITSINSTISNISTSPPQSHPNNAQLQDSSSSGFFRRDSNCSYTFADSASPAPGNSTGSVLAASFSDVQTFEKAKLHAKMATGNDLLNNGEVLHPSAPRQLHRYHEMHESFMEKKTFFDAPVGQGKWQHPMILEDEDKVFFLDGKFMRGVKERQRKRMKEQRERKMKELCEWPEWWKPEGSRKPVRKRKNGTIVKDPRLPKECTFRPQTSFDLAKKRQKSPKRHKKRQQNGGTASMSSSMGSQNSGSRTKRKRPLAKRDTQANRQDGSASAKHNSASDRGTLTQSPSRNRSRSTILPRIKEDLSKDNTKHTTPSASSSRHSTTTIPTSGSKRQKKLSTKSPKRTKGKRGSPNQDTSASLNGTSNSLHDNTIGGAHIDPEAVYSLFMFSPKNSIPLLPAFYSAQNAPVLHNPEPRILSSTSLENSHETPLRSHPVVGRITSGSVDQQQVHLDPNGAMELHSIMSDDGGSISARTEQLSRASSATLEQISGSMKRINSMDGWTAQ